ncbi:MAG: glycoside hydrolase [Paenibacillaceae bacterium]|jgi:hypothetical protein|nr:glycoside hydrolase [Paenibacillaceae bacterium]
MNTASEYRSSPGLLIPRPEYPRPDWQREEWLSLNGRWSFQFDPDNAGIKEQWQSPSSAPLDGEITVPFSWASPLSGIGRNEKGIGWYRRTLQWAPASRDSRLFLRFGAVDYACDVWINGEHVGSHQGGYGTFEFDITRVWLQDSENVIAVRAEDEDHSYQARGKQGYGEIRGIWQPVWLEARPQAYVQEARFITAIDGLVEVAATIVAHQAGPAKLQLLFDRNKVQHELELELVEGENQASAVFTVADPQLWSPETPYLYEGRLKLAGAFGEDMISTYFGIREVGTGHFDGRGYRYITLNGKPVYLNGVLDQSFHPAGYFTYPTDEEMQNEIYLMKRLGLNLVRIHIKPEEPRKLYWADKLGILVMEDMPCFWGSPDEQARSSYEREARETILRDYNHPSIFSWVMFNETWGLFTGEEASALTGDQKKSKSYLPATQQWVKEKYHWAKQLDPSRLVEDNSPCNRDHVETDLNTWHFYINGYENVRDHLNEISAQTYPGSSSNYIGGHVQSDAPLMNSECGNVWGIDNGAGDSDLAWHYHYMINEFRKHDKLCGFVFTEFRDVVNEFNGFYRLDGSDKDFGYEAFVPGMRLADLHTADFIVIDAPPCQTVEAGATVAVPLMGSSFSDCYHGQSLELAWELWYDNLGIRTTAAGGTNLLAWDGYGVKPLDQLTLSMPRCDAAAVLALCLLNPAGEVITRNFATFDVRSGKEHGMYQGGAEHISVPVTGFKEATFPYKWTAVQDNKVNGGGAGHFAYDIRLPGGSEVQGIAAVEIFFEASAKRVLGRNIEGARERKPGINLMHGGSADVDYNPNTYYMTDDERHASRISVLVDGEQIDAIVVQDDPADSRGVLSWHYQPVANKLDEAGSYGYLCRVKLPGRLAARVNRNRSFRLELAADEGGLALYGRNAGRYPIGLLVRVHSF